MYNKHELREIFTKNIVDITFKKIDGSERTLKGTLNPQFLPEQNDNSLSKKKAENENVLPVWDLNKKAFRSFRIDSVLNLNISQEAP